VSKHLRRATNLPDIFDVDAEKNCSVENKTPNAKPGGKTYPISDQDCEMLLAFSDQNSLKTIYPLAQHMPISGSTGYVPAATLRARKQIERFSLRLSHHIVTKAKLAT